MDRGQGVGFKMINAMLGKAPGTWEGAVNDIEDAGVRMQQSE